MEYSDFVDAFDKETFEVMAKEYLLKNNENIKILQAEENLQNIFYTNYENFLTILMTCYREDACENLLFFDKKIMIKKDELRDVISDFCGLYKEVKNDYFFAPFLCINFDNFDIKNELKNMVENMLFFSSKIMQNLHRKKLINLCLKIAKFL